MGGVSDVVCPECNAGKHGNCDGTAWDFGSDRPVQCPCWMEAHWIAEYDGRTL